MGRACDSDVVVGFAYVVSPYHVVLAVKACARCWSSVLASARRAAWTAALRRGVLQFKRRQSRLRNTKDSVMSSDQLEGTASVTSAPIVATSVPEGFRLGFLPRHFGRLYLVAESAVYSHMGNLCPRYTGGYWDFMDLSNGGCYMAPGAGAYALFAPNGFEATVDGNVAGLIASLYAFSHVSFQHRDLDVFADRFHQLREFALEHAKAGVILAAID